MKRVVLTIMLVVLIPAGFAGLTVAGPSGALPSVYLLLQDSDDPGPPPASPGLRIGTNLAGMADWGTEIPFVNLMRVARQWYTKSVGAPNPPWNSELANQLTYRSDGYPIHIPQTISESPYPQEVATIWAKTDGWPAGKYTVLWDGIGNLAFHGVHSNLQQTSSNRIVFDLLTPGSGSIEMRITNSSENDPVRNIRVLMPGTESTYATQPFYKLWLEKIAPFKTFRFMDWGQTNNWGERLAYPRPAEPRFFDWHERSRPEDYTWTTAKGVPYEMMVRLMNDLDVDGWVCVPHNASSDYIASMAAFFRDNLEPGRHLYVEYSNEVWNWMFDQTQFLNEYGCIRNNVSWPEGIVPYIQNCMDIWTTAFAGQLGRITRVVGTQLSWLDVSQRITRNMDPASFDAISPTYYFGLSSEDDAQLDVMGEAATAADIAAFARAGMPTSLNWISQINDLAIELGKKMVFYEGGQHLTPHPFGEEPTYGQALLDIQRDPLMYELYMDWFAMIKNLQDDDNPFLLMNFSFVGGRSARYGSWGILETMDQDLSIIPAPKYQAILDTIDN
ncbi:MAG: hypothetical protein QNJ17_10705 [Desulfocapsaceae bacterium]|nr:hypothetical protein [Desulfocapsaceae bacterium]